MANTYCCVPMCNSWKKKEQTLSFFKFPSDHSKVRVKNKFNSTDLVDRREVWIDVLKIGKNVSRFMKVCSLHFNEEDFLKSRGVRISNRRLLKKTAVPTQKLPVTSSTEQSTEEPGPSNREHRLNNLNMSDKHCFVPHCRNNSYSTPNKYFLRFPNNKETRKKWFEAIDVTSVMNQSKLYICEDHFSLEEDADNFMYFKTFGSYLRLKKNVVPHKNINQQDLDIPASESQISSSQRKRKQKNTEEFRETSTIARKKLVIAPIEMVFIEQKSIDELRDELRIKEERVDQSSEEIITRDPIDGPNEEIVVKEEQADEYPNYSEVYDNLQLHMKCEVDEEKFYIPDQSR